MDRNYIPLVYNIEITCIISFQSFDSQKKLIKELEHQNNYFMYPVLDRVHLRNPN